MVEFDHFKNRIMTIKELKQAIADLPDDMDVFMGERLTEETFGLVNSTRVWSISVGNEEDPDAPIEYRTAFILMED